MLRPSLSLIIRTCEAPCVLPAQQETVTEFFIRAAGHRLSIYTLSEARDIAVSSLGVRPQLWVHYLPWRSAREATTWRAVCFETIELRVVLESLVTQAVDDLLDHKGRLPVVKKGRTTSVNQELVGVPTVSRWELQIPHTADPYFGLNFSPGL